MGCNLKRSIPEGLRFQLAFDINNIFSNLRRVRFFDLFLRSPTRKHPMIPTMTLDESWVPPDSPEMF
jgi:hypothetical protein